MSLHIQFNRIFDAKRPVMICNKKKLKLNFTIFERIIIKTTFTYLYGWLAGWLHNGTYMPMNAFSQTHTRTETHGISSGKTSDSILMDSVLAFEVGAAASSSLSSAICS